MPRFDFTCESCGSRAIDVVCDGTKEETYPDHCGQRMALAWDSLPISAQIFEAVVTKHIRPDGQPMRIASKGDLEFISREWGVRRDYDDPDLVASGNEIRKKTPSIGKVFDMGRR